jgi:hypothetical protein
MLAPLAHTADFRPRLLGDRDAAFVGMLAVWTGAALIVGVFLAHTPPAEVPLRAAVVRIARPQPVVREEIPTVAPEPAVVPIRSAPIAGPAAPAANRGAEEAAALLVGLVGSFGATRTDDLVADILGNSGLGDVAEVLRNAAQLRADADLGALRTGTGGRDAAVAIQDIADIRRGTGSGVDGQVDLRPEVHADVGELAEVEGDRSVVAEVVRQAAGRLRYCYEVRLQQNPQLSGRIEIGWSVAADGGTWGVHTLANETGDAALEACVESKISRLRFEGASGDVVWPFVFTTR